MTEQVVHERVVEGLGAAPGVGMGVAFVCESGRPRVPEYHLHPDEVAAEHRRLREAVLRARRQLSRLRAKTLQRAKDGADWMSEDVVYLLDAYLLMLKDSRLLRSANARIAVERLNAESAVQSEVTAICGSFRAMEDAYLASRADVIREVGNRVLAQLMHEPDTPLFAVPRGSVLIAEELTPAETAQLKPDDVLGIAAQMGGPQGHTAILARALGLPAVLGATGLLQSVRTGDPVLVDGDNGRILIHPSSASLEDYERRRGRQRQEERDLRRLAGQPAITRDGVTVSLRANVELPMEMDHVARSGAAGIGLLRTEFLFMNRATAPSESEQYEALRDLVERAAGECVTIRTLDLGGDKGAMPFVGQFGNSATSPLGVRGIRLSLAHIELLETQFRAILRASAHGPVRILLPMVTSVAEIRAARDVLARAARRLFRRGVDIPTTLPPLGPMIEVPGAALTADALALVSDFFAVGSNDLTMYTLAIDRSDERVAHLYDPLHPGVLRMIQFAAAAALRARIPVCACGEIAGDPVFAPLLLGLGFRELSMTASNIPRVKRRILDLDLLAAQRRVQMIMDETDPLRIRLLLDEFANQMA
ncbi:MAG: phosphoenolpyruvate--protein phosphotransferase [Rhodospirillales bacterium]|nr:phosphoenolpyruvate--protein phosphotransferase [Rhodospirillales bacterium]